MVILVEVLHFNSILMQNIANIISIEFAILVAFYLHSTITWRKRYSARRELIKVFFLFQLITITSVIVRIVVFYLLSKSGMEYSLNTLIGIVIAIAINFLGYKNIFSKLATGKKKEKNNATRGYGLLENFLARKRANLACHMIKKNDKKGAILDLGCGTQPVFLTIAKSFTKRYGLDQVIDSQNIELDGKSKIILKKWDMASNKLPFEDNRFDVVSLLAVIEHFDRISTTKILKETKRVLKDEGMVIITTPSRWTEKLLKFLAYIRVVSPEEIEEHKEQFTRSALTEILKRTGFKTKTISSGSFELTANLWAIAKK
ncbi:MAG: methyltransferase domain-containing protein [Actinobacteria bacterium]|nr:methyltransferase domain-containing protein [Actinomycetota bacterium]